MVSFYVVEQEKDEDMKKCNIEGGHSFFSPKLEMFLRLLNNKVSVHKKSLREKGGRFPFVVEDSHIPFQNISN